MPNVLKLIFGADANPFVNEMRRMERHAHQISARMNRSLTAQLAPIFGIASIGRLTRDTIDWAGKLRDSADALGVNVEWLQKMQNGAQLAGGKLEDMSKFLMEMNRAREDAFNNPKGKNAAAFGRMGITQSDITGLNTQQFFDKIMAAFNKGATTQLVNDVIEVGGKSARNLIAAFSAQFASDTPILAEELIDQLDDIGDAFTELKTRLMVDVAPAIIGVANAITNSVKWLKDIGTQMGAYGGSKGIASTAMDGARYNRLVAQAEKAKKLGLTKPGETKLGFFSPDAHVPTEAEAAFMKDFEDRMAVGGKVVAQERAEVAKQDQAISSGRTAARAARRQRETAPPLFVPAEIHQKADGSSRSKSSSSVSLSENQRHGAYAGIQAVPLLDTARQQLAAQKATNAKLDALINASKTNPRRPSRGVEFGGFRTNWV